MENDHDRFMRLAIEEAQAGAGEGEQPFGAVVVRDGAVVVSTHSLKVGRCDPTAHAETLAISRAARALGRRTMPDCVFYATCEPCPMCLGAILNGEIGTLVVGARYRDIARSTKRAFDYGDYAIEAFAALTGWNLTLVEGVRQRECLSLYTTAATELTR